MKTRTDSILSHLKKAQACVQSAPLNPTSFQEARNRAPGWSSQIVGYFDYLDEVRAASSCKSHEISRLGEELAISARSTLASIEGMTDAVASGFRHLHAGGALLPAAREVTDSLGEAPLPLAETILEILENESLAAAVADVGLKGKPLEAIRAALADETDLTVRAAGDGRLVVESHGRAVTSLNVEHMQHPLIALNGNLLDLASSASGRGRIELVPRRRGEPLPFEHAAVVVAVAAEREFIHHVAQVSAIGVAAVEGEGLWLVLGVIGLLLLLTALILKATYCKDRRPEDNLICMLALFMTVLGLVFVLGGLCKGKDDDPPPDPNDPDNRCSRPQPTFVTHSNPSRVGG